MIELPRSSSEKRNFITKSVQSGHNPQKFSQQLGGWARDWPPRPLKRCSAFNSENRQNSQITFFVENFICNEKGYVHIFPMLDI